MGLVMLGSLSSLGEFRLEAEVKNREITTAGTRQVGLDKCDWEKVG